MKIKYLPHTADIRMHIEGENLEDLFGAGLLGMTEILKEGFCAESVPLEKEINIKLKSNDLTCLLIDFLSEVLSIGYTTRLLFCKVRFEELSSKSLNARLSGRIYESLDEEIKAVTYHEAQVVEKSSHLWQSLVVFDI